MSEDQSKVSDQDLDQVSGGKSRIPSPPQEENFTLPPSGHEVVSGTHIEVKESKGTFRLG